MNGYPLSAAQLGIWLAQKFQPGNALYNVTGFLDIDGPVAPGALAEALRRSVSEAEALRVHVAEADDGPRQVLDPVPEQLLDLIDVSDRPDPVAEARAWMAADAARPTEMGRGPLYGFALIKLAQSRFHWYTRFHHIVMDGSGYALFAQRVEELYAALAAGSPIPPARFGSLAELVTDEVSYQNSPAMEEDRAFWADALPSALGDTAGPAEFLSERLVRRRTPLPQAVTAGLLGTAGRLGVRWSTVAIAAVAAYLHRTNGTAAPLITLPVPGRLTDVSLRTPGMLLNELPLCLPITAGLTFDDLVRQTAERTGAVFAHQRYRVERLARERGAIRAGQSFGGPMLNIIAFNRTRVFAGLPATYHPINTGPVRELLIGFYGEADGSGLDLHLDANAARYDEKAVAACETEFLALLESAVTADGATTVGDLSLLPGDSSRVEAGAGGADPAHGPECDYDLSMGLHELVDEQVRRTPDATAVSLADRSLTYQELADRSDRLARHLREQAVRAGHRVGVCDVRSLELVVDLLAVLKAGGAYVPLDPDLPAARLEFQLRDAGIDLVLTRAALADRFVGTGVTAVVVDELLPTLPASEGRLPKASRPASPAYVMYTSGSTGQPKGVVVSHRGVVNRLFWMRDLLTASADDRVLQKTPFTFDVSVWEFFWPLITGGRLVLAEPGRHRDPRYLAETFREQGITVAHFVPPMLDAFLSDAGTAGTGALRAVVCSGEALRPATVRAFFERYGADGIELYNMYGPTEASIDVSWWRCRPSDADGPVPIGWPAANTSLYIRDRVGDPVPDGQPGELCVAGVQVASCYLNRPELTADRFTTDPVRGEPVYRTGDLARRRADGAVEFLGRSDDQIKIRGFRIEPGDVEAALEAHPDVSRALAVRWERADDDHRLLAYLVPAGDRRPDLSELIRWAGTRLPEYMVPAHFMILDEWPIGPTGKVDRRALPVPDGEPGQTEPAPPETPEQRLLHKVWQEILGATRIGLDDSFFALGGDSMLSIRVRAALERHGYTFAAEDLFAAPTIRALAGALRVTAGTPDSPPAEPFCLVRPEDLELLPAGLEDAYPLSAMQAGMLYHTARDEDSAVYRVVTSVHVPQRLDLPALARSIDTTVARHPALRTSFDLSRYSEPLQLVHRHAKPLVEVADDVGDLGPADRRAALTAWMNRAKYRRFDVAAAPLLAFTVHPAGPAGFDLAVVEHHAILDGWSDMGVLSEIVTRYQAVTAGSELDLPAVPCRVSDFVAAERAAAADPDARRFWTDTLRGVTAAPLPRAADPGAGHRILPVPVTDGTAKRLTEVARREGLPLKAVLAAVHAVVLRTLCGQDRVLVGLVSNGRLERSGGDEVAGVFLNTLPLPVDAGRGSWLQLARQVFERERDATPYRRYPYASMRRDLGGEPLLESYLNVMGFQRQWAELTEPDVVGIAETDFPLTANALVDPGRDGLAYYLDCDLEVLDADLCRRMVGYYKRALELAAAEPGGQVGTVDLRGEDERRLLASWNDTTAEYEPDMPLHALIAGQAQRRGDASAVVHRDTTLTYTELVERASRLAHHLRAAGAGRGGLVGVCLPRGPELLVALLAVLQSGAAYVPLDPGFPATRLAFIAADAALDVLITDRTLVGRVPGPRAVLVDAERAAIEERTATPPPVPVTGADAAYVMYTSGSTGKPKGVRVDHRNLASFLVGMDAVVGVGDGDVVLAATSVSFDISVLEMLWPLSRGATVILAGEKLVDNLAPDPEAPAPVDLTLVLSKSADDADRDRTLAEADTRGYQDVLVRGGGGAVTGARVGLPPAWLTTASSPALFAMAGATGMSLLVTPLPEHDDHELTARVASFKAGRQNAPAGAAGRLSVLLPTAIDQDVATARRAGRELVRDFLRGAPELWPALFTAAGRALPSRISPDDLNLVLDPLADRYLERSALVGTPATVGATIDRYARLGVDGIGCLVDAAADLDTLHRLVTTRRFAVEEAGHSMAALCERHGVTIVQATPSFYSAVAAVPEALAALRNARCALVGGEAFPPGLAARLAGALPESRILNMYGPTETTIWSTSYELDGCPAEARRVPIGRPIANTQALVLDQARRPAPIGVAGELWIGGAGVTAGYLGRPELTAERFLPNPFAAGTMYRTGDQARWRHDGVLEFLGRIDRQVKIRGHRVEPDEVEGVLSSAPQVASVAVVAAAGPAGATELIGYVSPAEAVGDAEQDARLRHWADVWDGTYDERADEYAGWLDSTTRAPIPAWQMADWVRTTVQRIAVLEPASVVDCGVGTGLILRELAPRVTRYLGIDISPAALAAARAALPSGADHVTLVHGDARYLAELPAGAADTVVINSVAQYFPSADYLTRVVREAVRVVGGADRAGAVFIGDVRHLDLLDAFHADVELHRVPPLTPVAEIAAAARRHAADERELCLAPAFFHWLASHCEGITAVRVEPKRGRAGNEITAFRYDVTLLTGTAAPDRLPDQVRWESLPADDRMAALAARLADDAAGMTVTGIPNGLLADARAALALLSEMDGQATAWDAQRRLWQVSAAGLPSPEQIAELGARTRRRVRLLLAPDGAAHTFDAVFEPNEQER